MRTDINKINEHTPHTGLTEGMQVFAAGTSKYFKTGEWRNNTPVYLEDNCKQCLLCAPVCPDSSIPVKDQKRGAFDYRSLQRMRYLCKGMSVWSNQNEGGRRIMGIKERMSGNEAVAYAIKQVNPDVMPAFPITPSTEIPQMVSTYIANGEIDTEFIPVESEHSAMSASIGAEAAGARTLTATSSAGLALMWEELLLAASNRMPIALTLVNRTLSGPININCDHTDGMGARDTGWIQIYAENNQEVYDNFIQAYRIAEHKDVRLPIMICQDGFITSHAVENIELLEDAPVKEFVGEYHPEEYLLNPGKPVSVGPYAVSNFVMESREKSADCAGECKTGYLRCSQRVCRNFRQRVRSF